MKVLILCLFLACTSAQWSPDTPYTTTGTGFPYTTTAVTGFPYTPMTSTGTYFTDRTGRMTTDGTTAPFTFTTTPFNGAIPTTPTGTYYTDRTGRMTTDGTTAPFTFTTTPFNGAISTTPTGTYFTDRTGRMTTSGATPFTFNPMTFTSGTTPTITGTTGTGNTMTMNTRTKRQVSATSPTTYPFNSGITNIPSVYPGVPYTPTGTYYPMVNPIDQRNIIGTTAPFTNTPIMAPFTGPIPTAYGITKTGYPFGFTNTYPGYPAFLGANPYTTGYY